MCEASYAPELLVKLLSYPFPFVTRKASIFSALLLAERF